MSNKFPPSVVALGLTGLILIIVISIAQFANYGVLLIFSSLLTCMIWYLLRCWVESKRKRRIEMNKEEKLIYKFSPGAVAFGWLFLMMIISAFFRMLNYHLPTSWIVTAPTYFCIIWYLIRNWVIFNRTKTGNENPN